MRAHLSIVIALAGGCGAPSEPRVVASGITAGSAAPSVGSGSAVPPAGSATPAPTATGTLRGVDWCNRGYGDTHPALSNCRGDVEQRHRAGEGMWGVERYRLANVVYGDLTGDGREDALLIFETTLKPVIISNRPPVATAQMWLIEQRGADLFMYTTESATSPPASVSIANGVAVLEWRDNGMRCEETWRFAGEGQTAVKSARRCRP